MPRYELASGLLFSLIALAQLTRLVLNWPVTVANTRVSLWVSAVAFLITGVFAAWAFRTFTRRASRV